ncbi:glutamyl-tRNA reductase [Tangfeifania diversioriginum]|uniref:Glutamyl-tRNA reductase n=1 Tax=Tangfeifania diversioriginum TaxID=1168035 RepID=A0A1M6F8L6_9BACT|nr:glutamyl-tRNA reductase [Tangfeifania diversioriginum]SHI94068.1 glutamyl-tRNA reductase [Tangfeifania diversioriginum]
MIGLIGISHKTSPLEIREKFAVAQDEIVPFSEMLQKETDISDIVVLSTCNRTEIYFSQNKYDFHLAAKLVYKTLKQFKGIQEKYWHTFYSYTKSDAVRHLFEVASGVDSMIIGEDQIIGQIKDAYVFCTEEALTDAVLMRLFQKSFETSKKVRSETEIKMGNASISSAAVQKCITLFEKLSDKRVLLIGAGETGSLVLQNLHKNGVYRIALTNRTQEKAEKLAKKHKCTPLPFEHMPSHLYLYDIVIVATGSKIPLVTTEMAREAAERREGRKQVYIDISVPHNIETDIGKLGNVNLYTIDDLDKIVNTTMKKRKGCIDSATQIIDDMVADFDEWMASRSLRPAIKAITYNMQKVTKEELSGYNKVNSEDMQLAIRDFSKHLTQKYTRMFIKNLKELTANGKNTEALDIVNELFNISEE